MPKRVAPVMVKSGAIEPTSGVGVAGAAGCCAGKADRGAVMSAAPSNSLPTRGPARWVMVTPSDDGSENDRVRPESQTRSWLPDAGSEIPDRGQSAVLWRDTLWT